MMAAATANIARNPNTKPTASPTVFPLSDEVSLNCFILPSVTLKLTTNSAGTLPAIVSVLATHFQTFGPTIELVILSDGPTG
jgi:hypothetical protein